MAIFLKQSTASQEVALGPFVDSTDGVTAETALTINNTDIKIHKAGATTLANKNSGGATHISGGIYYAVLDATDTDTLGSGQIHVSVSGALPVKLDFCVLPTNIYDSFIGNTDVLDVSVTQWTGTAVATPDTAGYPKVTVKSGTGTGEISLSSGEVTPTTASKTGYRLSATGVDDIWDEAYSGHLTSGSTGAALGGAIALAGTIGTGGNESTTVELPSGGRVNDDDYYNNMILEVIGGTGVGQSEFISDYVGSTGIATLNGTLATMLDGTSVVQVRKFGTLPGASAPTASQNAAAVWDKLMADHRAEGSFGSMIQSAHNGTAQAGGSATITLDATGSSSTTDYYKYATIEIVSGTGIGQSRQITAYNGTSKVATVDPAWTTQPSTDSNYVIRMLGIDAATTAQIADAVWDEARAGHVAAGSFGEYVLADSVRISGATAAADGLEAAVSGATPLPANVTQISGDATAADNAEAFFDGTGYAGTNNVIPSVTTVTGNVNGSVGSVTGAVGSVTGNVGGNVVGSVGSVTGNVGGTIGGLDATARSHVNAEVLDVLTTDTFAEPASVPAATSSIKDKINWVFAVMRNKLTQTATTQTLRNDGDAGNIATRGTSDDGSTFTQDKWS